MCLQLVGEDGVGKASVVRGLAHRFAAGDVPKELKGYRVRLKEATLQGTQSRGLTGKAQGILHTSEPSEPCV